MSVVTIQVGQCGNQLGSALFEELHEHATAPEAWTGSKHSAANPEHDSSLVEAAAACKRAFFRDGGVARAIIIDTEPKVIQRIVAGGAMGEPRQHEISAAGDGSDRRPTRGARSSHRRQPRRKPVRVDTSWRYDQATQVCCHAHGGAANNWAYGYHVHGAAFAEACLESVRREVERCDHLTGLSILQSAAGGTGSGLGTYLTEALRDDLPSAFLLNSVVCAHGSGEVILQNYNTLFTLSKLAPCSDGILVIENEVAMSVCKKLLRLERPSHADLNSVICTSLVGTLAPASSGSGSGSEMLHIGEKLTHLCPNKDYIFLRASMVPQMPDGSRAFTSNTWEALTRRAYQMHITGALADLELDWRKAATYGGGVGSGLNQSVSSLLTFHGSPAGGPPQPADSFRSRGLYAGWSPSPFRECRSPLPLHGHDRAVSLVSNSQAVLGVLDTAMGRSRGMYEAGAYVHHYEKFGTERDDFENAFVRIEQAAQNYRSLGFYGKAPFSATSTMPWVDPNPRKRFGLEAGRFLLYLSIPVVAIGVCSDPKNMNTLLLGFNFVQYPPEEKKIPTGEEIKKMMQEREAKRLRAQLAERRAGAREASMALPQAQASVAQVAAPPPTAESPPAAADAESDGRKGLGVFRWFRRAGGRSAQDTSEET